MRTSARELLATGIFGPTSHLGYRIELLLARDRAFSPQASVRRLVASAAVLMAFAVAASLAPRWIALAQHLEFEVASIKPHAGEVTVSGGPFSSGPRVRYVAVELTDLVTEAYGVRYEQVSGSPGWGSGPAGARYDIEAKAEGDAKPAKEQLRQMLQSLLAERFRLKVRRETVDTPIYALVLAKGGSKLKAVDKGEGVRMRASGTRQRMDGKAAMEFLAQQLSISAGRLVLDRTGLIGNYEFTLEWTPDNVAPPDDSPSISIFTAVQEQLGLKLEPAKAPVEMLIIEHAEMPTEN
jgi:uncharacterized protein (TIGR03435 family)